MLMNAWFFIAVRCFYSLLRISPTLILTSVTQIILGITIGEMFFGRFTSRGAEQHRPC